MASKIRLLAAFQISSLLAASTLAQPPAPSITWGDDYATDAAEMRKAIKESTNYLNTEHSLEGNPLEQSRIAAARRKSFARACQLLSNFDAKWIKDTKSVNFLMNTFWVAYYAELADDKERSIELYLWCYRHPQLENPGAVCGQVPIQKVIKDRLKQMATNSDRIDSRSAHADNRLPST